MSPQMSLLWQAISNSIGAAREHNGKIYLQFAILCNVDTEALLKMIALNWLQIGGSGLQVKDIAAFNTESPFAIYFLCNDVSPKVLTEEL